MSRATQNPTTPELCPPQAAVIADPPCTRRKLFGASAAMLLVGSAEAGEAKAAGLDGDLLGLVADLQAVQAKIDANDLASLGDPANVPLQDALDAELGDLQDVFWPIAERIVAMPAHTPEGVQAKARAARTVWLSVKMHPRAGGSTNDRMVFSLFSDVLGEG